MNGTESSIQRTGIGADVPPGWRLNPSRWSKRLVSFALAFAGFAIATYLALYQLRVIRDVWEPFFGNGSQLVLHSSLSRLLPVPDATLGALGYLVEVIAGVIGGGQRWRTSPWAAVCFGGIAAGMALASAVLVACQPFVAHAWCTLCLCSSGISFIVVGPAVSELRAALQTLKTRHGSGRRSHFNKKNFNTGDAHAS